METVTDITQRCKNVLSNYYGTRFKGLILYGSIARNQSSEGSDIDLLVLLSEPFDYFQELYQIIDLLYPVQLDSAQLISAKPAAIDDFERRSIQLYRNVVREGITL